MTQRVEFINTLGKTPTMLALTAWGQEARRDQSPDAGCDGHLIKPVALVALQRLFAEMHDKTERITSLQTFGGDSHVHRA